MFFRLKKLFINNKSSGGRNNLGRITSRHRGGGCKRRLCLIDFTFSFINVPGFVLNIEKEFKRSSFLALILYKNGFLSYILAPYGLKRGDFIVNSFSIFNNKSVGSSFPLSSISVGSIVHNIELYPGQGGCFCRSAGSFGIVIGQNIFDKNLVLVRLKSKEEYLLHGSCFASIGMVSNFDFSFKILGTAGFARKLGRRPKVRGVAMNPFDHPHGGGEGKTSGGRFSVTPKGKLTKGKLTRSRRKISSKFIVRSRRDF